MALPPATTDWSGGVAVNVNSPVGTKFAVSETGALIVMVRGVSPAAPPVKPAN